MNGIAWWAVLVGTGLLVWPAQGTSARRLGRLSGRGRLPVAVAAAAVAAPAGRVRRVPGLLLTAAGAAVAVLLLGTALGIAATAGALTVALPVRAAARDRRRRRFRHDLTTALAVLRGELDAGTGLPDALRAARERSGSARAVLDLDARAGPEGRVLAAGAAVVASSGAPWSDVVAGIVRDATARDDVDREVGAALAGARSSMLLLAGLPVLGLLLAAGLGAHPLTFLLHAPAGRALLAAGAVLQCAGVAVTVALANRATS